MKKLVLYNIGFQYQIDSKLKYDSKFLFKLNMINR